MNYQNELKSALEAVRLATRVCENVQHAIEGESIQKNDRSPVTVADYASQAIICRHLHDEFPRDPIIAEEDSLALMADEHATHLDRILQEIKKVGVSATAQELCSWIDHGRTQEYSSRFWTLDPIDGTKGFLRGEQYAISLALIVDGEIQLGIVACPNLSCYVGTEEPRGVIFHAVRGEGTSAVPLEEYEAPHSTKVSRIKDAASIRRTESVESSHSSHDLGETLAAHLGIIKAPFRLDSQAKYAVVARGEADLYLRLPTKQSYQEKIWDHAGGVIVVEEAGGKVTDMHGNPLDFTHGRTLARNSGIIVSNGLIHDEIIRTLASLS